jgi:hypothetical protein
LEDGDTGAPADAAYIKGVNPGTAIRVRNLSLCFERGGSLLCRGDS